MDRGVAIKSLIGMAVGMGLASMLSGCNPPVPVPQPAQRFLDRLESEWDALLVVLQGGRSPFAVGKVTRPRPSGSPSPSASDAAVTARNAELLQEMFKVIYVRDFQDPREFADYVDTLNQGASVEGLYNGFTRSSFYRKLEMANTAASPRALAAFAMELARLELALPKAQRTLFEAAAALPLARPVQIEDSSPAGLVFGSGPKAVPSLVALGAAGEMDTLMSLATEYRSRFQVSSIFTLKRILGEESMKIVAHKVSDPAALAAWYGKWVADVCNAHKVDFGLELRNRPDAAFHEAWAKGSTEDHLRWEVLNRLHRILNETGRKE